MNTFEIEYLKIINEENDIKTLYFPTEIKKFNFKSFTILLARKLLCL